MLVDNLNYITHDVNIILRRYQSTRQKGVTTLLRLVLKLKNINECSGLLETLQALLVNLDLSWVDPDSSLTLEILQIILVVVESLQDPKSVTKEADKNSQKTKLQDYEDWNNEKGVLAKMVLGKYP